METNKDAYIRYDPEKETAWIKAILTSLKDEGKDYYKVESLQLVTMLLIVISKRAHQPHISEVSKTYAGVGLMNMMGNKGGIAIRLRFHDSYLCFVTSHLAAFTDNIERRNQDFTELSKRLLFNHNYTEKTSYISFSWNDGGDEGVTFLENNNVVKDWRRNASVFHNDFLVWCGDLNYRINLGEGVVKDLLNQGKMDLLLKYDQLSIERGAGRTFSMFDEGDITFAPTYKYDAGTDQYDTSKKRRAPSWTDRILWKKENIKTGPQRLKLLSYSDCMEMMMSDHKPVRALMSLDVRKIDKEMQKKTLLDITHHLAETKDEQPYAELSSSFVEFGNVDFMEYKETSLTLTNTGRVLTFFEFIQKVDEKSILPPWLQVTPLSGVIAPGEKVVLRFEITVDPTNSTALNLGEEELDDVLVLHLEDSRDFFVSVTGNYKPTCLGLPLEKLDKMSVPIIGATREKILGPAPPLSDTDSSLSEDTTLTENMLELPEPLWKLLNFLGNENMFKLESLFLKHGDFMVSTYIRECLDKDKPFDPTILLGENTSQLAPSTETTAQTVPDEDADDESDTSNETDAESKSANSMIDVLITFLDCLPEPIISTQFYERALDGSDSSISFIKENLDFCHRNALLYIGVFLRQAIDHAPESCKAEREASIIENFTVLLRPPLDFKERNPVEAKQKREKFISELLKTLKI
ncbi:DNase I-like protein [Backusella circina FSU 941]|nr:DNase I-like protein [Backusella circina FSU 941]